MTGSKVEVREDKAGKLSPVRVDNFLEVIMIHQVKESQVKLSTEMEAQHLKRNEGSRGTNKTFENLKSALVTVLAT